VRLRKNVHFNKIINVVKSCSFSLYTHHILYVAKMISHLQSYSTAPDPTSLHVQCTLAQFALIVSDSTISRTDSFRLLQSVLMNVIGLYVSSKFGGNVKLLMYDEL